MSKNITMDQIVRLSKGKKSGGHLGSRGLGHHLKNYERVAFERALRNAYLVIDERDRDNLWHLWEKVCLAKEWPFYILIKKTSEGLGLIYDEQKIVWQGDLAQAKKEIKLLAQHQTELV